MTRLLYFSFLIFLFSCGNQKPKDLLSVQQMQDIKWDLMRADEMVEYYKNADTLYQAEKHRQDFYSRIYSIHHITKETFKRSLDYYTARPKELKQILDGVQAKAEKMNVADTAKTKADTVFLKKDSGNLRKTIDSLKRKKLLKIGR